MRQACTGLLAAAALCAALVAPAGAAWAQGAYNIEYSGGPDEVFAVPEDDFFSHMGPLYPGQSATGSFAISNASDAPVGVAFFAEEHDAANRPEARELMELAELSITCEDALVYAGPLSGSGAADPVHLGSIEPGGALRATFELSLPADLGNEYALAENEVMWGFEVTEDEQGPSGTEIPGGTGTGTGSAGGAGRLAKTGFDATWPLVLTGSLAGAGLGVCVIELTGALRRRRREGDGEDGEAGL